MRVVVVPSVAIDCEDSRKFYSFLRTNHHACFDNKIISKNAVPFVVGEIYSKQAIEKLDQINKAMDWFSYDYPQMKVLKDEVCSLIIRDVVENASLDATDASCAMKDILNETKVCMLKWYNSTDVHMFVIPFCQLSDGDRTSIGVRIDAVIHVTVFSKCAHKVHIDIFEKLINSFRRFPFGVLWNSDAECALSLNDDGPEYYKMAKLLFLTTKRWINPLNHIYDAKVHSGEEIFTDPIPLDFSCFGACLFDAPERNRGNSRGWGMHTKRFVPPCLSDDVGKSSEGGEDESLEGHSEHVTTSKALKRKRKSAPSGNLKFVIDAPGTINAYMNKTFNNTFKNLSDSEFRVSRPGHFIIYLGHKKTVDYKALLTYIIQELKSTFSVNCPVNEVEIFMCVDLSCIDNCSSDTHVFYEHAYIGLHRSGISDFELRVPLVSIIGKLLPNTNDVGFVRIVVYNFICVMASMRKIISICFTDKRMTLPLYLEHNKCMICGQSDEFTMDHTSARFDASRTKPLYAIFDQDSIPIAGLGLSKWKVLCCQQCFEADENVLRQYDQTKKISSMPSKAKCTIAAFMCNISKCTHRNQVDMHESLCEFWTQQGPSQRP